MRKSIFAAVLMGLMLTGCNENKQTTNEDMNTTLQLTQEWDKTFPKSDKVDHKKVTFKNRYGIELAADMYWPKEVKEVKKFAAIAVTGPFGAVKEQTSGLYAQHMAERGFLTIAFDPSFTGESAGEPRRMASPDINTEDFLAAVDFLSNQENVDAERIGIIGICGFGGMAVNAAAIDPRIKATVASTMYDMSKVNVEGLPTVAYFADKACLSPNYFGDLISKESGTTAQRHIQDAVIERSKQLLLETKLPISEIAYQLGFQYSQHFTRLFKSRTGMTPNEYRLTA